MKRCTETDSAIMRCPDYPWKCEMCGAYKEPTNADNIRSMTDEELAEWMAECNAYGEGAIASQWMPWLKQPYEEEV